MKRRDEADAADRTAAANETESPMLIRAGGVVLEANLGVPEGARGIVLFAHGSGSSRHSPRNAFVAAALREAGLATVLMDLLTPDEEEAERLTRHLRFDIDLLAGRLTAAAETVARDPRTRNLRAGYFGASTGAAAALAAAAARPEIAFAVVSRGGRPDLAGAALERVLAPTLLIAGGNDPQVIALNREALARINAHKRMEIVEGATHLFEEPGTLEQVAALAADWFSHYLDRRTAEGQTAL